MCSRAHGCLVAGGVGKGPLELGFHLEMHSLTALPHTLPPHFALPLSPFLGFLFSFSCPAPVFSPSLKAPFAFRLVLSCCLFFLPWPFRSFCFYLYTPPPCILIALWLVRILTFLLPPSLPTSKSVPKRLSLSQDHPRFGGVQGLVQNGGV